VPLNAGDRVYRDRACHRNPFSNDELSIVNREQLMVESQRRPVIINS
jgi:hypothetical protein